MTSKRVDNTHTDEGWGHTIISSSLTFGVAILTSEELCSTRVVKNQTWAEEMTKKINWFDNVEHRSHPWPGLNWLTTAICVPDAREAVTFYTDAMDMVAISELEDEGGDLLFARMRYRGVNFTINKEGWDSDCQSPVASGKPAPFIFYLYVDDAEKLVGDMVAAGATVLIPLEEKFWGDLKSRVKDPFGYVWDVAQKIR